MGSVKLNKFLGEAPKVASELLPDGAAQTAFNVKLYSGDLLPYREPKLIENIGRQGTIQTLYKLINYSAPAPDPEDGSRNIYLTWLNDVDIATANPPWVVTEGVADTEQRYYYTGDGVPKVSNYSLATSDYTTGTKGAYPVPNGYYELGVPLPTSAHITNGRPTATETSPASSTSASYARDAGNIATVVTGSAHGLRTGNIATIRDFGTSDEAKEFNSTNVEITKVDDTTFQYFNPGDQVNTTSNTSGKIDLAGASQIRTYVFTFFTPWDEEGIPSLPSNDVIVKEGQTVTVSNLPTAKPSGDNFVRGIRLYRSVTSAGASEYFLLKTLWFPTATTKVKRASNVVTVTLAEPHNFIIGDKFKLSGTTTDSGSMNGTFTVASVVDKYSFTYSDSGSDVSEVADANGTLFHDVSEDGVTPIYWGDSNNFNFTDSFNVRSLSVILPSEDYDVPPASMKGITQAHNNIFVGFFENQVCFSFPNKPHAWPEKFRITLDSKIVAIAAISGYILVLTDSYPYQISGNDPATMVAARIDTLYPCLSKRSVVNMGYGVVWASHGGLASYSAGGGIQLVSEFIHDWDTWNESLSPASIVGHYYNGKYFGSHTTASFIFERDEKVGGIFVQINYTFTAACNDYLTGNTYYIGDNLGNLYEWDDPTQPQASLEWKSKTIVLPDYMNLGAARVIADYDVSAEESANITNYNLTIPAYNNAVWAKSIQLGCINGPTDYTDTGNPINNVGTLNAFALNGDGQTRFQKTAGAQYAVTFKLFADKTLLFQGAVSSDAIFRLPTGYRSDTFEVSVSGSARVRAVHIGETPYGLRAS